MVSAAPETTSWLSAERVGAAIRRRIEIARRVASSRDLQLLVRAHLSNDPVSFVSDWCWTFDPRLRPPVPATIPFLLWPKQVEFIEWLHKRVERQEEGAGEKSRDFGASYMCIAYAIWRWLFHEGFKTTFGANKSTVVDQLGNPDSILEKGRIILRNLPPWIVPEKWSAFDSLNKIVNPRNGNVISGEAGDNMGRGGRATLYVIDEAAFVERPDKANAATAGAGDCRIWLSSVYGPAGFFAQKRSQLRGMEPAGRVIRLHWRDDPRKDDAWAAKKRAEINDPVVWAREYEIDDSASREGVFIPAQWVAACVELYRRGIRPPEHTPVTAGLDVGGGGRGLSVYVARQGPLVRVPRSWPGDDTTNTANRALLYAKRDNARELHYDAIGVGAGVKSTLARAEQTAGIEFFAQYAGDPAVGYVFDDSRKASDFYANRKAQWWFTMREAARKSFEHLSSLECQPAAAQHEVSELLIIDPGATDLIAQLSYPGIEETQTGKIRVESKDSLARRGIASPDHAEALSLTYGGGRLSEIRDLMGV